VLFLLFYEYQALFTGNFSDSTLKVSSFAIGNV